MPEIRSKRLCGDTVLFFSGSDEAHQYVQRQCNAAIKQSDVGVSQRELASLLCLLYTLQQVSSPLCIPISPYLPQRAVVKNK